MGAKCNAQDAPGEDFAYVEAAVGRGQNCAGEAQVCEYRLQRPVGPDAAQPSGFRLIARAGEAACTRGEAGKFQQPEGSVRPAGDVDGHVQAVDKCALVACPIHCHQLAAAVGIGAAAGEGDEKFVLAQSLDTCGHGIDRVGGGYGIGQGGKAVEEAGLAVFGFHGQAIGTGVGYHRSPFPVKAQIEGVDEHYIIQPFHYRAQIIRGEGLIGQGKAIGLLSWGQVQHPQVALAEVAQVETALVRGEGDERHTGQITSIPRAGQATDQSPATAIRCDEADSGAVVPATGSLFRYEQIACRVEGQTDGAKESVGHDLHPGRQVTAQRHDLRYILGRAGN